MTYDEMIAVIQAAKAGKAMLEAFDYAGTRLVGKEYEAKEAMKAAITQATAGRE